MLTQPFPDLERWLAYFRSAEIPVFRETAAELARLREREDDVSAAEIAEVVSGDPLMSLKVLAFTGQQRSRRVVTDAETVKTCLVLMGISPFFRAFESIECFEDRLAGDPFAPAAMEELVHRAFRAANFALGFAVIRTDTDAEVLRDAAMLHDFAEMLLWCHAPMLAARIRALQRSNPALRSADAQRRVLNIELRELQHALIEAWHLPELFAAARDRAHGDAQRGGIVRLAVDLARHSQHGWDNPALPDDYVAMAALLKVTPERARAIAQELDG